MNRNMTKILAIIQARMNSTRLPNKVLTKVQEIPILEHIINRVRLSKIDEIIVATTEDNSDDAIEKFCLNKNIQFFRGDENNVLKRFYDCAKIYKGDIIVRITADDPFKDPKIINRAINLLENGAFDYVSNTIVPTFPEGIDIEVFTFTSLEKAYLNASLISEKEHVTPYIWKNPDKFRIDNFKHHMNLSNLRWTLDTKQDLEFTIEIYNRLYNKNKLFYMEDILDLLKKEPTLLTINQGYTRNLGYLKSLDIENEKNN